jgi:probable HAF family extracellular repeat protein
MLRLARTLLLLFVVPATLVIHVNAQSSATHAFLWSSTAGMQDLGSFGSGSTYANGINNAGQVVGYYEAFGTYRAFLWTASAGMRDLGTLGGDSAIASGINSASQVVGGSSTASGEVHAFLWTAASGMKDLGTLRGTFSDAVAINDIGDVTGTASQAGDIRYVAFLQTPPKKWMKALGTLGSSPYSYGYAINAAATVVGSAPLNKKLTPYHAFICRKGAHLTDIGSLGGRRSDSTALGINQSEQVVGWSAFKGGYPPQAFLWTATSGMQALVTLGGQSSAAQAINSNSQIVGFSDLSQTVTHAVLWTASDQIQDLSTLGGNYATAQSINDLGQVVGWSTLQ